MDSKKTNNRTLVVLSVITVCLSSIFGLPALILSILSALNEVKGDADSCSRAVVQKKWGWVALVAVWLYIIVMSVIIFSNPRISSHLR